MTRRIAPVTRPEGAPGYPSVADCALSRRGFLGGVLGGAAALGGALLPRAEALAGARGGWKKSQVGLSPPVHLRGGRYRRVDKVLLQTKSEALHRFLSDRAEQKALAAALRGALKGAKAADVDDRRRLARLEAKVSRAAVAQYRARTGRRAAAPITTLVVTRREPIQDPGFMSAPPAPMPAP